MRIRRIPSANAQAMMRVGSPARRSSSVRGGRRRRAADVKGAISDSSPGRPLMRIVRRPSFTTSRSGASMLTRSEEHTSELQSHSDLVCRLLLEKKKKKILTPIYKKKKKKKKT